MPMPMPLPPPFPLIRQVAYQNSCQKLSTPLDYPNKKLLACLVNPSLFFGSSALFLHFGRPEHNTKYKHMTYTKEMSDERRFKYWEDFGRETGREMGFFFFFFLNSHSPFCILFLFQEYKQPYKHPPPWPSERESPPPSVLPLTSSSQTPPLKLLIYHL